MAICFDVRMRSPTPDVAVKVLGALEVAVDAHPCELASRRQRALLTALVLRGGRPVTVTDLIEAVWDDEPPERARTTLQTYVSRLRGVIGQETVRHTPAGYRLDESVATDIAEVREAVRQLERLDRTDPHCTELAERALGHWRGPALAEFADVDWFRGFVVELSEMRANLVDIAADGMIRDGRCPQAVSALELSLTVDPLREPTHVLLIRALHGAGRNTDAVRAASRYRRTLSETTGLLPGAAFRDVEQFVLAADEATTAPTPDASGTGSTTTVPTGWTSTPLPRPTPLIGRREDLDAIGAALETSRLVTVVGVGGLGKTRLVAEFASDQALALPVLTIELATVPPDRVLASVGASVGLRDQSVEIPQLVDVLGATPVLVVIDNAEHAIGEVRHLVTELLRGCPEMRLLVTSRERLDVNAESTIALGPLGTDGPSDEAATLFVDRLRRARPHGDPTGDVAAIADICRRLEGIPLALELAASRAATLGVGTLNDRFDELFGHLTGIETDRDRHSTLGNVVHWSIDLLGSQSRDLLAALSVFHGDFDVDAVEEIAAASGIRDVAPVFGRLVDTSLVADGARPGRFRLLEMIRVVARQRLETSQRQATVRRAHADWVATQLTEIDAGSAGPDEAATVERLDAMRGEVLAAIEWSIESGSVDVAARVVTSLAGPLLYRPDFDLIHACRGLGAQPSISGAPHEAALVAADARAAFLVGDLDEVEPLATRAIALASPDDTATRHRAQHALGVVSLYQGDFDTAKQMFQRTLDEPGPDVVPRLDALGGLALAMCYSRHQGHARAIAEEHRSIAQTIESDTYVAFADYALAEVDLAEGDIDRAAERLAESADRAWRTHARFVWGISSTVLARVLVRHRPRGDARRHLPTLITRWRRTATWPQLWTTLRLTAEHLVDTGDGRTALLILTAADRDDAAPSLSDDETAHYRAVRERATVMVGGAAASGIVGAAAVVDRADIVRRALAALEPAIET